ncbi:MAG: chemotaxis protein CheW [Rhodocyclaceae bacterium]|nr:chemotaxis protein CheW [Rhodocyclaceae bacterium]
MSDFAGMEDLLQDYLVEATDLLSSVENKLVDLEINPQDHGLLNDIFRGFHTIKGGAGFLNATELVALCHLTESLFEKLRNGEMAITQEMMDVILAVTGAVREMFGYLESGVLPPAADAGLIANLKAALAGQLAAEPDWDALFGAVVGAPAAVPAHDGIAVAPTSVPADEKTRDNTIRVDTAHLDRVMNLSGEIGLTKNRLNALRSDILNGRNDSETLQALDQAVSQLDLLVSDLQNAVLKTRMQPTLPVLLVQLGEQPFAVPLSMVREILPIRVDQVQEVGGRATMVVRGEVMPIYPIAHLLGWAPERVPEYGVLMQTGDITFILAVDGFMGREDAVIKSLEGFRPKGVAGVTTLSNGQIVLILDMKELFVELGENRGVPRSAFIPEQRAAA